LVWTLAGVVLIVLLGRAIWLAEQPGPDSYTYPDVSVVRPTSVFRLTHPWLEFRLLWARWEDAQEDPAFSPWLVALGFLLLGLLGATILWKLPKLQVSRIRGLNRKERFDKENEARKTLATILGGVALLTGGYFTWKNFNLTEEGQITERYTKAVAQLGDDKLPVRLGGIYSLEAIARESKHFHWPVVETLSTYVREKVPIEKQESLPKPACPADDEESWEVATNRQLRPSADIQAILTVLGTRSRRDEKFWVD